MSLTTPSASIPLVSTIFGLTYLGLAVGKVPGLRIDRAGIALVGAAAMLASGVFTMRDAARAVDYETIVLLFGMMVVVAHLRMAGFFALATDRIAGRFSGPFSLLGVTIALSGILSAFLVNDVVCVALTPLVLHLCQRLKRPPIPYLVGLATASNVGSVATITGNPQNMIIGSLSHISYIRFAGRLAPVALVGLFLNFAVVALVYRRTLASSAGDAATDDELPEPRVHRVLLGKSLVVTLVTVGLFFSGQPIALVALVAAGVLLLSRVRPEKVYKSIDWPLLVMFAGLFVVVSAFETNVVRTWGLDRWEAVLEIAGRARERPVGGPVEPGVERSGGAALQAAHGSDAAARAGVAGACDVEHAGGEPDRARLGREPDRRRDCEAVGNTPGLRRVSQGRCAADLSDDARRRRLA